MTLLNFVTLLEAEMFYGKYVEIVKRFKEIKNSANFTM